jgi:lysophospholipase L1-like esterase
MPRTTHYARKPAAPAPTAARPPTPRRRQGEATRRALVAKMKAAVAAARARGDASLQLLDLEKPFDWWSMSPEQRKQIFDDGVHLTDYGYQQYMAGLIYDGMVKILGV